MKFRNLKIRNLKMRNLKIWNLYIRNLKLRYLKTWNLKTWNLKIRNSKIWNSKIQILKIPNWKLKSETAFFRARVLFKTFLWPTYVDYQLWFWKYSPNFFVLNLATFWASFALFWALWGYFLVLWGYFWSRGQVQKHFLVPLMQSINFDFGNTALYFCFYFDQICGLFCPF